MNNKLSENTWYIESAKDFYWKQNIYLEKANIFNKMWWLYNKRLNQILSKNYEDISWQKAWDRLLRKVIRDKNKIQFLNYLKYLVDNWKINSDINYDDVDQIWDLQDKLHSLKEQTENIWKRDFHISSWYIWSYKFDWRNNIEYIWNNKHILKINFQKIKRSNRWIFKYKYSRNKNVEIWIKYNWWNIIEFYEWKSFNKNDYLWYSNITHKEEFIEENKNSYRKINFKNKYTKIQKVNKFSKTKSYIKWVEKEVYLKEIGVHLMLQFNK